MPALFVFRLIFGLLSLAILATAGVLLWTWYRGDIVYDLSNVAVRVREDWRLWIGLALLAFSFGGRFVVLPMLARADKEPYRPRRGDGAAIDGASGSSLLVETTGPAEGPPLVLTHGWGLDSTIWTLAKRDLAQRFRLIMWDLPGLGRSKTGQGRQSLELFAADLRTIIGLAGGRPVVLVGHSIGGMTIQTLARDAPEMFGREIAGVVLLNTTYTNPLKTMIFSKLLLALRKPVLEPIMHLTSWLWPLAWAGAWQSYWSGSAHIANRLEFAKHVTRAQLEHTTLLGTRNPQGAIARGNLAMFRWDATGALNQISVPVLVIGGEQDIVTKAEASRVLAAAADPGDLQVVAEANHMGFVERADIYNRAIAAFANSVQPMRTLQAVT